MTKLDVLQKALIDKNPIEFIDKRGSYCKGTVVRVTWDDYEDICSVKNEDGRVTTLPVNNISINTEK